MNLQRWACIAFANMFAVGVIFLCNPCLLDLYGDSCPIWAGVSLFALAMPLILLVPLAPGSIMLLPALNSLVWAAFWEWIISRFLDPSQPARRESQASVERLGQAAAGPAPPTRDVDPSRVSPRGPSMRRYWWLVGFNYLTCAAFALLFLTGYSPLGPAPSAEWWHVALLIPISFPLVPLVLLVDRHGDVFALLFVNAFFWAALVEAALRTFFDRPELSDGD